MGARATSGDLFDEYLQHLKRLGRKASGEANNRSYIKRFSRWLYENGIHDPVHASQKDLEAFLSWLRDNVQSRRGQQTASASTIAHYQGFLRGIYGFLKDEGRILTNPMSGIPSAKVPKRIRQDVLDISELKRLLDQPDATHGGLRDLVALRLMAFSGLRVGALCRLRLDDINMPEREVLVRQGKGSKDRLTFFDPDTRRTLARYLVQARPALATAKPKTLLVDDKGKPMRGWQVKDMVARYIKRARIGKHVTPHSLRRTFCTLLLTAGCNLKVVSELAGHNSLDTTAGYTKLDTAELSRVYNQTHPRGSL